jgi:hypothetical protein
VRLKREEEEEHKHVKIRVFTRSIPLTGTSVLLAVVVVILLAAVPGAIRRIVQTGDPYLLSQQFCKDIIARLSGTGRLRFILQPIMAIFLGARDGIKDARATASPFLWGLIAHGKQRAKLLRSALLSVRNLVAIAVLLDMVAQFFIFGRVHPAAALIVGPVLIAVPYAVSRALSNRFVRRRTVPCSN